MKQISLVRLIIFSVVSIFIVGIMHHLVSNNTPFTIFPENFGRTHFIQGVATYPQIPQQSTKKQKSTSINVESFFCPSPQVCEKLCSLINNEKQKINIAIYTITDNKIAQALITAKKRGVIVEIITDRSSALDRFTKIGKLYNNDIPVFLYQPPLLNDTQKGLMHNKFALFFDNDSGKQIIWHGSFNFTASGYKHNCESILIIEDHATFKNFEKEFERIKKQSMVYKPNVFYVRY